MADDPAPQEPASTETGSSAADEAAGLADPPGHRWWRRSLARTPDRPCLNCGDATVGWYCPTCGQRKGDVRVSLRRMVAEFVDDQLSLSSTLPRTLGALFLRPGHLTREYVQGRIARYAPPFRLYLISSLVFFIMLPLVADPGAISLGEEEQARVDSLRAARMADSVLLAHARAAGEDTTAYARALRESPGMDGLENVNVSFAPDPTKVPAPLRPLARRLKRTESRLNSMPPREALRTLVETFEENAPIGVFLMMPLFAAILKLLYVRRKRFYVEHFVFALHVHAFAFLTATAIILLRQSVIEAALFLWMLVYVWVALWRVYGQGALRTTAKYLLLGASYSALLIVGVLATALLTALSL